MSKSFDEILTSLENVQEDSAMLMTLLIEVRKKVDVSCPKIKYNDYIIKIRKRGSLQHITSALQTSKKEIINCALSILGNCCMDTQSADQVITHHSILSNLNHVLKRFPKEDSINGRVFRIVGNLCQHRVSWGSLIVDKKPQIVIHITEYLKNAVDDDGTNVTEATVIMGVRSLRELVNQETLEILVSSYGVLKTVGMLLIKYGTIWQETKKSETVVLGIIKLLQEYSKYKYTRGYNSIIPDLRNTGKGDAIAHLAKILLIAPQRVIKIVMNLLNISRLKSELPIPEMFDFFVQVLQDKSLIQDFNPSCQEYVKCLCRLFDHPGNRDNERCGDSIPLLISVLNDLTLENDKKVECCITIIKTFIMCRYNDSLINKQISCDIVTVLTEKLRLLVGQPCNFRHESDGERSNVLYSKFSSSKRTRDVGKGCSECQEDCFSDEDEIDAFSVPKRSGINEYPYESYFTVSGSRSGYSPSSSPEISGLDKTGTDSDDYSPVCSEADPTDSPTVPLDGEQLDSKNSKTAANYGQEFFTIPSPTISDRFAFTNFVINLGNGKEWRNLEGKTGLIMNIIHLLRCYIQIRPVVTQLGNPDLLLCLMKSSIHFDWPYLIVMEEIVDVICKILSSHDYLLPLMATNFVPFLYQLETPQHNLWCSKCQQIQWMSRAIIRKITRMAESGGGNGAIAHMLLRGDDALKQKTVLIVPYIVRKPLLVKFMVKCGGLEMLLKLLQETPLPDTITVGALSVLASKRLSIPNPVTLINSCKWNVDTKWTPSDPQRLVTFKFDDESVLDVDRDLLSQNSDFFNSMLNGGFKESSQDVITLPNVDKKAFNFLIDFMSCDSDKTDLVDVVIDLTTHLAAIGLCDRFLMEDRRGYLNDCVEKFRFTSENIPIIYKWSLESGTNMLRVECIAFALVGNVTDWERIEMFKKLLELGSDDFIKDLRSLLSRYLDVKEVCQCKQKKNKFLLPPNIRTGKDLQASYDRK